MKAESYQWSIFQAYLDPAVGSEQAGTLPVIVVSNEAINQKLGTITVVPLTSRKPGRRIYPTEVLLNKGHAGLKSDSLALAQHIRTISKKRLIKYYGAIVDEQIRGRILDVISLYLDLPSVDI